MSRITELRKKHQPYFDSMGIPDAYFYPKMAYRPRGKDELYITFFTSELEFESDIYTEFVSKTYVSEDPERNLWKYKYNPHWREEYELAPPGEGAVTSNRYFIPVSELVKISIPATDEISPGTSADSFDSFLRRPDAPLSEMTMRDLAAIIWKAPVSAKEWLNTLIKKEAKL